MTQILYRTAPTAESAALLANALEQAGARVFSITRSAEWPITYELWARTEMDPAWVDSAVKEVMNGVRVRISKQALSIIRAVLYILILIASVIIFGLLDEGRR